MKPQPYLSAQGKRIFKVIYNHCKQLGIHDDIDTYELSMLANSFCLYADSAKFCNQSGIYQVVGDAGYKQVTPEYTAMNKEYANVLKHSAKFGLNPSDRDKLTKAIKSDDEDDDFDLNLD